jgi:hypothetical protein
MWKTLHTGLHNTGYDSVTSMLRHRLSSGLFLRNEAKLLEVSEKMLSKTAVTPGSPKIICENSPKPFPVSDFPPWEYFS